MVSGDKAVEGVSWGGEIKRGVFSRHRRLLLIMISSDNTQPKLEGDWLHLGRLILTGAECELIWLRGGGSAFTEPINMRNLPVQTSRSYAVASRYSQWPPGRLNSMAEGGWR